MSHTTTVKADIRSVSAIKAAVAELKRTGVNVVLKENTQPRMYYANQHPEPSAYVLHFPDCRYDVGLDRDGKGGFTLAFDAWGGDLAKQIGDSRCKDKAMAPVSKFIQSYTKHAAMQAAQAKGYIVSGCVVNPKTGEVNLTINVN